MTSENDGTNANSYEYDARGYLVRMTSDETSEHSDMRFIYDHRGRLMAILHGAAYQDIDRAYVWMEDQVLAQYRPSENPKLWWIVGDHLGTPALLYSTTTRYAKAWYSPYGELIQFDEIGGAAPSHDLRFPGQIDISTSGAIWPMYYNMNRWYMPGWGRYSQSDPIGHLTRQQLRHEHMYVYAENNPLAFIDPLGLDVHNNGNKPICIKPEKGPGPVVLPPGETYDDPIDGVSDMNGDVIKITDPYNDSDIEVGPDGVNLPGPDFINNMLGGGKLDCPPDDGWKPLFECAKGQE